MQNTAKTTAGLGLRGLLQSAPVWFLALTVAAFALRLFFVLRFPSVTPDGIVYADLAKNWLLHGVYGMSGTGPSPTFIRLPGYPAFLAVLFAIFGIDHYNAARFVQVLIDIGTCFVVADLARRVVENSWPPDSAQRVARWAFALTALCPFLANYTALPLTETPAIFLAALALDFAVAALQREEDGRGAGLHLWAASGLAIATGIYLRPDGGVVLIAIGGYLLYRLACKPEKSRTFWAGVMLGIFSLGPLAPCTLRNGREFHRFEPLAPAAANSPEEFAALGFQRWELTWLADFASVEDVAFKMDGEPIPFDKLPSRAFDNEEERRRTEALFAEYNDSLQITPAMDAQFAELARARIRHHPLRYYVVLPLVRTLDMWLRPRTEMLPIDVHWWNFRTDPHDSAWAMVLGIINLGYVVLAVVGLRRWRAVCYAGMLLALVVVRTALITILTFPEPRYVLECFPVVMVFGSVGLSVYRSIGQSAEEAARQ